MTRSQRRHNAERSRPGRDFREIPGTAGGRAVVSADPDGNRAQRRAAAVRDRSPRRPVLLGGPACRVCCCTEYAACLPPCSWIPDPSGQGHLCSACEGK